MFHAMEAKRQLRLWIDEKENRGAYSWTIAQFATLAQAEMAGMSLEEYWQQIIAACYLDHPDPIAEWQRINAEIQRVCMQLNTLSIQRLHIEAAGTDLWVTIGPGRQWLGGRGCNLPSYEIFTSPDWRGTEGVIVFTEPIFRYGKIFRDVCLRFERGLVVEATASEGQEALLEMLRRPNANKLGEVSLTDRRLSRVTRFMANTLYDENRGGEWGNAHVAVGRSFEEAYTGDPAKPTPDEWQAMGFNQSSEHTDFISTSDRTVTAELADGTSRVIYKSGQFQL
jgi:aminopeptidase